MRSERKQEWDDAAYTIYSKTIYWADTIYTATSTIYTARHQIIQEGRYNQSNMHIPADTVHITGRSVYIGHIPSATPKYPVKTPQYMGI